MCSLDPRASPRSERCLRTRASPLRSPPDRPSPATAAGKDSIRALREADPRSWPDPAAPPAQPPQQVRWRVAPARGSDGPSSPGTGLRLFPDENLLYLLRKSKLTAPPVRRISHLQ